MSRRRAASVLVALALLVAAPAGASASSFLDPRLHFRTIETEHFLIYFHAGEDRLAAQLAVIAEEVWPRVGQALGVTAPRRTHVMLVDQSESANGWATPLPYNTIFITSATPAGYEFLGNDRDWLRLVFTHEFTHIVHLDWSRGWARLFRGVFGRTPVAFPNSWLPRWQIEGLAVWEESQLTGEGRRYAADFRALETTSGDAMTLNRVNGGLTRWPGGLAPYAFGLGFHEYLANRFGEATFATLAATTAGRLPFWSAPAFKRTYHESLGTLWNDYQASVEARAAHARTQAGGHTATRLTWHGYGVGGPRFLPPACEACGPEVIYTRRGPDEFPALYTVAPGASAAGEEPRRLTSRYLGNTVGVDRALVVFDQHELRRNAGLYSDLYLFDRRTGNTRSLTREARLQEPDLSPDGRTIAAVRESNGARDLVLVRLSQSLRDVDGFDRTTVVSTDTLMAAPGAHFNTPRWSPDGASLVVARQRPGAPSELVVVDATTAAVRIVAASDRSRIVTPTWTPDGSTIVAAVDGEGRVFDLYEFSATDSAAPPRRITVTENGALWPDVSSDGRQLTFAGLTADGYDVFVTPYGTAPVSDPLRLAVRSGITPPDVASAASDGRTYRPWGTLAPTSWFPVIEADDSQTRVGAAVTGGDVLRRHLYAASATWLIDGPDEAVTPKSGVSDWNLTYVYDRWRPTFFVSSSSETLFAAGPPSMGGRPTNITVRERQLQAGVVLAAQHVRATHRALISAVGATDRVVGPGRFVDGDRVALRLGASTTTAQTFAYSISPERGIAAGVTMEMVRRGLGASADATTATGDLRAYLPAFGQHDVVALRLGGGTTSGPIGVRRTFVMGGLNNVGDVVNFNRDAFGLLRGFSVNTVAGSRVAVFNADYRVPIARPERGFGTWPLFLRNIHATVFADAGHAWSDRFQAREVKTSLGGELVLDFVAGYSLPVSVAIGAAVGHDGATDRQHSVVYGRFSRTF